jgi:hypothetical protein
MTVQMTPEMRQAIAKNPRQAVYVTDDLTQETYVLLPADEFEKVQALLYDDTDPDPNEFLPLAHEAFKDAWDAPGMDAYDKMPPGGEPT